MALVEAELREEYRVAGELVIAIEQIGRLFAHHEENV